MTPERIERTCEFILQHQAQTAVHLDRIADRLDRLAARHIDMQALLLKMTELAEVQSRCMDRNDAALEEFRVWQQEALSRLDQILHRLPLN
jgi:uncharacterized protein Smg (DUF494 family)